MAILIIKRERKTTWVEQDVEKLEPLHIAGGTVNGAAAVENNGSSSKAKHRVPYM